MRVEPGASTVRADPTRQVQMALQEDKQWQVFQKQAGEGAEGEKQSERVLQMGDCSDTSDFGHPAP